MMERIKYIFKLKKLKYSCFKYITIEAIRNEKTTTNKIKIILLIPVNLIKILFQRKVYIPYIETVLTTVCNLKCKGCSALMEYYKNPKPIDLDVIIKSYQRIIDSNVNIRMLKLLGGEPLSYPKLYELLEYLNSTDGIKIVEIVTNGTMAFKDKKVINILKNSKFRVSISNYGETSKDLDTLVKQLKDNNIYYTIQRDDYEWVDYGNLDKRNRSEKELIYQYNNCRCKRNSLLNGKLFHCYRCSHATNLKLISLLKKDYIDLIDESISHKELKKQLHKFYYSYTPYIESCDYCDYVFNIKKIPKGKQNFKRNNKK